MQLEVESYHLERLYFSIYVGCSETHVIVS